MGKERQDNFNKNGSVKTKNLATICVRIVVFFAIGAMLFGMAQSILMPKRFPYVKSYDAGKVAGYYTEKDNSMDVLICSTSHASKGILPMEMYEKYGIKSYNLSTSIQPIQATYYLLSETLSMQKPKVFIFDVSSLYISSIEKNYWLYVLDEMRLGKSKMALVREYKKSAKNCDESTKELLIPLLRYHTRWNELNKRDFTMCFMSKHDYSKGGQINSIIADAGITVEEMNEIADELLQNTEKIEYIYDGEKVDERHEENIPYVVEIPENNIEWLKKIKTLCDENQVQFLAVKVPTVYLPQSYHSAWTQKKCDAVRSLCNECGITYYDMLYDVDASIDWSSDSIDGGQHLNLYGSRKVSSELGKYLKEHYELSEEPEEQWDKDLILYREVRDVAELELQNDFTEYIQMLANKFQNKMIFICASGDMTEGLEEENINALRELGLQTDFSAAFQKSYLAVVENGNVKYEALSNRHISYNGICDKSGKTYNLYSSGWWTNAEASIRLADVELVNREREGLDIVVYDDEKALVIDNVCFDMSTKERIAIRDNTEIIGYEIAFERYIAERENR